MKLIAALTAAFLLLVAGCAPAKGEGFAIYLTKNDVPPSRVPAMSYVPLADEPLITSQDIVSYDAQTHEIVLTEAAFAKISGLPVPVGGKTFMVCVDKKEIYSGAFWTLLSSIPYDGVIILKPNPVTSNQSAEKEVQDSSCQGSGGVPQLHLVPSPLMGEGQGEGEKGLFQQSPNGTTIRLDLGYPSEQYFKGEDPRDNEEVLESLRRAGKLK